MVLLSFSVKKDELLNGTKIRTTRIYTPEKYALWQRTLPGGDLFLDGWWKPRTKDRDWLFIRKGAALYRLKFDFINGINFSWRPSRVDLKIVGTVRNMTIFNPFGSDEDGMDDRVTSELPSYIEGEYVDWEVERD